MAAKRTSDMIPLCHPLGLDHVGVELIERPDEHALDIRASATCTGTTGVEMEALSAASVAALTVYDMCKAAHKGIVISDIRLLEKSGGRSGTWTAPER
jgi:cyclic pyranopterin phosphate synthase